MSEEDDIYPRSREEDEEPIVLKQGSFDQSHLEEEKPVSLVHEMKYDVNIKTDNEISTKKKMHPTNKHQEEENHTDLEIEKENQEEVWELIRRHQFTPEVFAENEHELKACCLIPKDKRQEESKNTKKEILKEMAVLNKEDKRKRVKNTTLWPYCAHGIVEIIDKKSQERLLFGTGTMVGPNFVLTAAHNLFLKRENAKGYEEEVEISYDLHQVRFIPAANESEYPYGIFEVITYRFPEEYKKNDNEDYAVLVLKEEIGYSTGYFGFHSINKYQLEKYKNESFELYGYPKGKNDQQWGMKGNITEIDADTIEYDKIDTSEGQSGSSIYHIDSSEYCVFEEDAYDNYLIIGVHTGNCTTGNKNIATGLSMNRVLRIFEWIQNIIVSFPNPDSKIEIVPSIFKIKKKKICMLELCIIDSQVDVKNIREFAADTDWNSLQSLKLQSNEIDKEGAAALAANQSWNKLQSLDLSYN